MLMIRRRRILINNQYLIFIKEHFSTYIANSSIPRECRTVGRLGKEWHVVSFFCLGQYNDNTVQVSSFMVSPPIRNRHISFKILLQIEILIRLYVC